MLAFPGFTVSIRAKCLVNFRPYVIYAWAAVWPRNLSSCLARLLRPLYACAEPPLKVDTRPTLSFKPCFFPTGLPSPYFSLFPVFTNVGRLNIKGQKNALYVNGDFFLRSQQACVRQKKFPVKIYPWGKYNHYRWLKGQFRKMWPLETFVYAYSIKPCKYIEQIFQAQNANLPIK